MRASKLLALAASLVVTTPALAGSQAPIRASGATNLSLVNHADRVGAPMRRASRLGGGNNGLGIAMLAVVLGGAAWAAYEMINGDDNDNPASP